MLKGLPDESVQMCVTSPPYWGLRDYGTAKWEGGSLECDHQELRGGVGEASAKQLTSVGASTTYQYREICGKCGAVRKDGQIGLEQTPEEYTAKLVDVFHEVKRVLRNDGTLWLNLGDTYHGGGGGNYGEGISNRIEGQHLTNVRNRTKLEGLKAKDLVGIPWRVAFALQADGWYLRQDIIWAKPNPMPESVTDRCTKAHEYIFLLAKSQRYYYDAEAIKEPAVSDGPRGGNLLNDTEKGPNGGFERWKGERALDWAETGRNRRSVWQIATMPYSGAHFATFPEELIEPCILAGSPEGGIVLDPFFGSGTTGAVSARLGRKWIGIELNPEYIKLAIDRVTPHDIQPQLLTACAAACEKANEMKEAGE